ncbi:hypothetical protein E2562_013361 [Oryza meyeriana var. granulata]|uniref:Uncharacterized protein n=1 Tax=Oryza meyeriana var. granulata TaxID=110450 RepID=A0A6G1CG43_9ORYZ|nr:hypothetical protein E2562_013361 [Oryza meyeriana var. granulata]
MADIVAALPPPPAKGASVVWTALRGLVALAAVAAVYGFVAAAAADERRRRRHDRRWKLFCASVMAMGLLILVGPPLVACCHGGAEAREW